MANEIAIHVSAYVYPDTTVIFILICIKEGHSQYPRDCEGRECATNSAYLMVSVPNVKFMPLKFLSKDALADVIRDSRFIKTPLQLFLIFY